MSGTINNKEGSSETTCENKDNKSINRIYVIKIF